MVPQLYGRLIARWRHGRCRAAKLWSEMRVRFWMWECRSHRRSRADQLGSEGRCKCQAGTGRRPGANNMWVEWRKNIVVDWKICWSPGVVLGTYKLLTDDFPIVQAFWWNIVFNPWTHGFFTSPSISEELDNMPQARGGHPGSHRDWTRKPSTSIDK